MDERPANVVEELVRDGIAPQRERGIIPRVNEVKKYVAGIVERLERSNEDQRLRIRPAPVTPAPKVRSDAEMSAEYQKRIARAGQAPMEGSWDVSRAPIKRKSAALLTLNEQRHSFAASRMRTRLRLLRSKPDWAAKIKAVNPLALNGQLGEEKQKHAEHLIREVIKASDVPFGPWMKAPAKKLWFSK